MHLIGVRMNPKSDYSELLLTSTVKSFSGNPTTIHLGNYLVLHMHSTPLDQEHDWALSPKSEHAHTCVNNRKLQSMQTCAV